MPYESVSDLPKAVLDKYDSPVKRRAFLAAFNSRYASCMDEKGDKAECEESAFAVAHSAAQRAGKSIDQRLQEELTAWLDTDQHTDTDNWAHCERCQDTEGLESIAGMLLCDDCVSEVMKAMVKRFDHVLRKQYAIPATELSLGQRLRGKKLELQAQHGFKVLPGRKWVAWYSNTYVDLENERFSKEAIQTDIQFQNDTGNLPELWFWHIPGSRHGRALKTFLFDDLAVAVGEFDDTPVADAMIDYYSKSGDIAVSHGFVYKDGDLRDGVYHRFHTFEVSALPRGKEANPFTRFMPFEEDSSMSEVNQEALEIFTGILGKEAAEAALQNAPTQVKELGAIASYKAQGQRDDDAEAVQEVTEQTPATEETPEQVTDVAADTIKALVTPLTESVNALVEATKGLHERLVALEQTDQKAQQPRIHNLPNQPQERAQQLLNDVREHWQPQGGNTEDVTMGLVRELVPRKDV